jgi:O-antigen/teichoic acid export membrane protein
MLLLAYLGYGVWTLVWGHIVRELVKVILSFFAVSWKPKLRLSWSEVSPYLRFGLPVMGSNSLVYVYSRADVFIGGPLFSEAVFGFYSLAHRLASMPNDKLLSIIHSISYPVFSRFQDDLPEVHNFYLKLSKLIGIMVIPIYGGGIYIAAEVIPLLIGDKWGPCVVLFQLLCVSQLITSLTAVDAVVNNSLGKPRWTFCFTLVAACTMVPAFYLVTTKESLLWLTLPWALLFPLLRIGFHVITVRGMGLGLVDAFRPFSAPTLATAGMLLLLEIHKRLRPSYGGIFSDGVVEYLFLTIFLGALWYVAYLLLLERSFLQTMKNQLRPE